MAKRAILIILDSVGIGELPDADQYGDQGSATLQNIAAYLGGLNLPHLRELGLGNIASIAGVEPIDKPKGNYGKMAEASPGKDTTTGHWEIAGIILDKPLPTFPKGFPEDFIRAFEAKIGRKVLGNEAASGTEIIARLGEEHMRTGYPIVYTSADSVFQIAAHEEVIPLDQLMEICRTARAMLTGDMEVSRVIARPFLGKPGAFYRTANRQDFAIEPPKKIFLEHIVEGGYPVFAVGKIKDIYHGRGVTDYIKTKDNSDGIDQTLRAMESVTQGLIMTNLVDFDMVYGHRNNVKGYAQALEEFDQRLPEILDRLSQEDFLIITADHGCDPTTPSTDHSREYVPLLAYGPSLKSGVNLGIRKTFADVGATVVDYLGVEPLTVGKSFYPMIRRD